MKVVRNYKGLKKWAKTTFVALLTICIIFTSTGVGSLIAYAGPTDDPATCTHDAGYDCVYSASDAEDKHGCICKSCHANLGDESCRYEYQTKDESSHIRYCTLCGATAEVPHNMSGGTCTQCGYTDLSYSSQPDNDTNTNTNTNNDTNTDTDTNTNSNTNTDSANGSDPDMGDDTGTGTHTHSYRTLYVSNNNGTHTEVEYCDGCGDTIESPYSETCNYVDGVCTRCGYEEPTPVLSSRPTNRKLGATPRLLGDPAGTGNATDINDNSHVLIDQFFTDDKPGILAESRTYDGISRDYFVFGIPNFDPIEGDNILQNVLGQGPYQIEGIVAWHRYINNEEILPVNTMSEDSFKGNGWFGGTQAGDYKVRVEFTVKNNNNDRYHLYSDYYHTINPRDFAYAVVNPPTLYYDEYTQGQGFELTWDGATLTENTDYTVTYTDIPDVMDTTVSPWGQYEVRIVGKGNYSGNKTGIVEARGVFRVNGQWPPGREFSSTGPAYIEALPTQGSTNKYQISLSQNGDYTDSITLKNVVEGTDYFLYCKLGSDSRVIKFYLFPTITPKSLTDDDITINNSSVPYNVYYTYKNGGGIINFPFTLTDSGTYPSSTTLEIGEDFTVVDSTVPSIPEASGTDDPKTYNVTITGKGAYSGSVTRTVTTPVINVEYTGTEDRAVSGKYYDQLTLTAKDASNNTWQISTSEDGTFSNSLTIDAPRNETLILYCKEPNTPIVYKKSVPVNVVEIPVKYGDSTTKLNTYTNSVDITAQGFTISDSETGTFNDSYTFRYDHSGTGNNSSIIDQTLYFKPNDSTGTVIPKRISGFTVVRETVPIRYNGAQNPNPDGYEDQVVITAQRYLIGTSANGPFSDKYTHTKIGEKQAFYLYFVEKADPDRDPQKILISDITVFKADEEGIPVKYNGSLMKKTSYVDKVTISADNYLVGTSMDGPFSSGYDHTKTGKDQSFYLYFVDKNDTSATPVRKLITGITVVSGTSEADEGAPTGSITVDTYKSDKIAQYKDVVYITKDKKEIDIKAVDDDGSPVTIEYFTSENFYVTRSEIEGAVTDKKAKWKTYYSEGKPTLTENTAEYIYARVSDASGNTRYLSTGKVIYDTKAPTVNTIALADEKGETVAVMTGKDNLSGIWRFYLKYEEKNKGNKTPTAAEVIAENKYIEELTTDDLSAAGRLKVSGLDPDKEYRFYGVAIDKAGNIGEVLVYDAKGKANADNSVSKNSISDQQGSAGNGAAASSNGIAGSGGTKPTPSSATSNWANLPESTPQTNPLDREINRTPYISEATEGTKTGLSETGGWDKIENEVTNAQSGTRMSVEMSGLSVIPGSMISKLQNKDVSVTIKMADGIEWVIAGTDVDRAIGSDIDLRVIKDSKTIPYELLSAIIDAYPHTEIDIAHDGEFGFTATLRVPFGESSAGMYGNLYYYDEAAGELKLLQSSLIGNDGYAAFRMSHASDYSIVVKSVDMLAALDEPAVTAVSTIDETTVDISDARAELSLLPQTGRSILGMRVWLFVMALICAAMCLAILFIPSFQREKVYN